MSELDDVGDRVGARASDLGLAQVPAWLVATELAAGTVRPLLRAWQPEPLPL